MWQRLLKTYQKCEKSVGNAKFAVVIIIIFACYLTYGTFMESYHGTEYANRLVYKSIPFMGVQLLMFLSIIAATTLRLPMKRHLYGFYVIHLGLITLFVGSFITYQAGVDGNLPLPPNTPARSVNLGDDQLVFEVPDKNQEVSLTLPYSAGPKEIGYEWEGIKVKTFLPFAEETITWKKMKTPMAASSGSYRLQNENFGEDLTLSLHPDSDFESTTQLGPLSVHYMPAGLAPCMGADSYRGFIIWNAQTQECTLPNASNMVSKKNKGQEIIEVKNGDSTLRFMPDLSPLPVDADLKMLENSNQRIFSKKLFEEKPHLFVFGTEVGFFDKGEGKWHVKPFPSIGGVELPWMGFVIHLKEFYPDAYPVKIPTPVVPIQDNGQLIKGNLKAVLIETQGTEFWVTSEKAMSLTAGQGKMVFRVEKKTLRLPFEITLERFKMDTDPGTQNPASYESFVDLFTGTGPAEKHHVFMNHPLKYGSFTFYQASYFQTEQGPYGSVFSVNYDPGRPIKYLGSLLLVLGSIWHFGFRPGRKKTSSKESAHA